MLVKKQLLKYSKLITSILLIGVFSVAYLTFFDKDINIAKASWWNDAWHYRKSIQISNNTSEETNVYVSLTIDTSATTTIQSDCGDLRFTKTSGKLLSYYIVSGCESTTTVIHVNFETFEVGEQAIYYYYGNESADNGFSASDFSVEASNYTIGAIGSEETSGGPVGYWSFDEGYGATVHDESSGDNNGTITGAVWKNEEECISGKCLYFDGVDLTRVDADVQDNMNEFTACVWIKANSLTNADSDSDIYILDKAFLLRFNNDGQFDFAMRTSSTYSKVSSSENIVINKWYYVCGVYYGIGTNPELYLNGVNKSTNQTAGSGIQNDDSGDDLIIGATDNKWASNFNGYIDEVKIYPYARTADQIKQDYNAGLAGVGTSQGVSASFGGESDKWLSDGLVGYWKMDESATTSGAIDSSGNGDNGIYEGTASTTNGKFGRGGVFDGDSDYIDIGNKSNLRNSTFSISVWVNPQLTSDDSFIVNSAASTTPWSGWGIGMDRGVMSCQDGDICMWTSSNSGGDYEYIDYAYDFPVGEWTHWLITYDDNKQKVKFYINGEEVLSEVVQYRPVFTGNEEFVLGAESSKISQFFTGKIDEVRLYNRALSPSEVKKLYEWAPPPILHLKMDEKTGTTTYDSSGNENNGEISGASWERGKVGGALDFDGDNDYVDILANSELNNIAVKTISAWIYPKSSGAGTIVSKINVTGTRGFSFEMWDHVGVNGLKYWQTFEGNTSSGYWDVQNGVCNINEWNYVAVVYDRTSSNNTPKMYVNGRFQVANVNDGYNPAGIADNDSSYNINVGSNARTSQNFNGLIDDVRIYNYARTQKQILEDMYNGNPMRGAILDLDFDEGKGEIVHDKSIFKNNGTLYPGTGGTNIATSAMWSLSGHDGNTIEFDGVDDYIAVGDIGSSSAISFWIKANSLADLQVIDLDGSTHTITISSGVILANGFSSPRIYIDGEFKTNIDTNWHHVFIETNSSIDVNNLTIGKLPVAGNHFNGQIDSFKIYPYTLNVEEIKKEYNDGKSAVFGSISTESDGVIKTNSKNRDYCVPGDTATCDPPVLELKMDEKNGATAYDTSGNGNDGSISGATWVRGKHGSALSFDGVNDIVDNLSLSSMATTTASMWIYVEPSFMSNYGILVSQDNNHDLLGYVNNGGVNDGKLLHYDNGLHYSNSTITRQKWQYVTVVKEGINVSFYINGVYDNTVVTNGSSFTINYIGWQNTANEAFGGLIDDVKIYDYARTPAQIAWDYNKGDPVAYYKFDECSGSIIHDESGNDNHGTLNLGTTGVTATGTCASSSDSFWYNGVDGKINSSGSFDGRSDEVRLTDDIFDNLTEGSIGVWAKWNSNDSFDDMFGAGNGPRWFEFALANNNEFHIWTSSIPEHYLQAKVIFQNLNDWHYFLYTSDNTGNAMYVDGIKQLPIYTTGNKTRNSFLGHFSASTTPYMIGATPHSTGSIEHFNGQIDEVKIWNYALTIEQIKDEYNGGVVRFGD